MYQQGYQRNKRRLGKQRGAKVAQIDIVRRLAHAIWHMLSRGGGPFFMAVRSRVCDPPASPLVQASRQ
jgi:hypothetical protein